MLVNGVPVVRDGKTVPNTFPGKPVMGTMTFSRSNRIFRGFLSQIIVLQA